MSLLDSLFGIQRIFVNGVETVTRKGLNFVGAYTYSDDPSTGRTNLVAASGGLLLTAPVVVDEVTAAYGQLVRLAYDDDPGPTVTLPPAAGSADGRVGILQTVNAVVTVEPDGTDTIENGPPTIDTSGQVVVLQSDGVSKWWVVSWFQP